MSTCLFLQYFYTCLFRMSGSIRLGRPNFAIKIFFKFNHDCFFYSNLYEVGWDVKACGWGDKSMAVKIVNTAWKKILTRLFPKHMTSILEWVEGGRFDVSESSSPSRFFYPFNQWLKTQQPRLCVYRMGGVHIASLFIYCSCWLIREEWCNINSLTPKISLVILLTVRHTIFMLSIRRIWYWIN